MARAPRIEAERPPPDALEGVPLPRQTGILLGHEAAERTLLDAYRSGRMHHGWILAGETGIGKATLAFRLARFVLAHPDPASPEVAAASDLTIAAAHPAAHRIAAGVHPNLLHLQREWDERGKRFRSELSVETVRRINPFFGTTAGEEGWRIVIVDTADEMSRSAANAILKSLEEPPRRALFLLVARSRGGLLPTILSRCRTLRLTPLTPAQTEAVAQAVAPDTAARGDGLATALAGGSPRRLIELRQSGGVELHRLLVASLDGGDRKAQQRLAALAAEPARAGRFMEIFEDYLARRVKGVADPAAAGPPPAVPLVTWAELWEKATHSAREVEALNLDRRQFVLDLLETSAAALHPSGIPSKRQVRGSE